MKKTLALLSVLMAGAALYGGSISYEFPLLKTAKSDSGQSGADLSVIRLDNDIYGAADNLGSDIRIVNSDGKEVPFAVQKISRTKSSSELLDVPAIIKKSRRSGALLDLFVKPDTSAGVNVFNGMEILSDAKNFEKKVTVSVFINGKWRLLTRSVVCDFSDYAPYRRDRIAFPAPTGGALFRITIENLTDKTSPFTATVGEIAGPKAKEYLSVLRRKEPLRLNGIKFLASKLKPAEPVDVNVGRSIELQSTENQPEKTVLTVKSGKQPITGFKLSSTSQNFSRHYTVEGQNVIIPGSEQPVVEWKELGTGMVVSCDYRLIGKKSLSIEVPESRFDTYRITIINGANAPLENIGLEASGPIYQLIMEGAQGNDLAVYYGPNKMPPVAYDVQSLVGKSEGGNVCSYTLGAQENNPGYMKKWYQGKMKYLLALIFVVVAGGIGAFLFMRMRKADDILAAADEPKKED